MNRELYDFYIIKKAHRARRKPFAPENLAEVYAAEGLSPAERVCRRFEEVCRQEVPHIEPFEKIVMVRTVSTLPDCMTEGEWAEICAHHGVHENGYVSNLCLNYEKVISAGLLAVRRDADEYQRRQIDALIDLCDRYRELAHEQGREDVVAVLDRVPRYPARDLREALQFFRILHYSLWIEGDYHNCLGRFDRYMYPYFAADIECGKLDRTAALELIEDFFISFNKDSDIYTGIQQGDNGQSMVLGGMDESGVESFNELAHLCIEASCELKVIDPKINLRVSKNTPDEIFRKGTELTRAGLGFPQYSNDDVVIDGLVRLGYDLEDARNYAVAACWEFIIPGCGNDIANIGAVDFPVLADRAIREAAHTRDFEKIMSVFAREMQGECDRITSSVKDIWVMPAPMLDLLRDGKKYNNFGLHGSGIAVAADALMAVKKYVCDEKKVDAERLFAALDSNYDNDPELFHLLRYKSPKMGEGNDEADGIAGRLMDFFSDALEGKRNCFGGVWRAGTGTAMYYIWQGSKLGATADGRRAGDPYGTNFSPSLLARVPGPLTDIESFTKHSLGRIINGGPLTLEFSGDIFKNSESLDKVAMLVKHFVHRGGHQLQLNAVSLEDMKAAQKTPDNYRQLVVRVWGWSGYFVELDREYQEHVMSRQEYSV